MKRNREKKKVHDHREESHGVAGLHMLHIGEDSHSTIDVIELTYARVQSCAHENLHEVAFFANQNFRTG